MNHSLFFVVSLMLVGAFLFPTQSSSRTVGPCRETAESMRDYAGATCRCRASDTRSGSIWGDGVYTDDSNICRAAVHAGVIERGGGIVRLNILPGRSSYPAVRRNGINSGRWGSWHGSFSFEDVYGRNGRRDRTSASARPREPAEPCPTNARSLRNGDELRCRCDADNMRSGFVYGSGEYSHISHICRAARHAGVIDRGGGLVRLRAIPGQRNYEGSYRNGIRSSNWAYSGTSIRFWRFRE